MNIGDVITTAEQLDALPRGTIAVGDEAGTWPTPWLMIGNPRGRSGLRVWDDLNSDGNQPLRTSAQVLERNRSVTVVFVLGHLPRPERVVKAEAWAEGFEAGHACTGATLTALCAGRKPNPYRTEAGDAE